MLSNSEGLAKSNLKTIDLGKKTFVANGVNYNIESDLSIDRYLNYKKLEIEMSYETGFYGMYETLKKLYELSNKMLFADMAVLINNTINGIVMVDNRRIPVLCLAALFINADGEDRSTINNDMIDKKINDWQAEGLSITPFFQLSISFIKDFQKVYTQIILSSSDQ